MPPPVTGPKTKRSARKAVCSGCRSSTRALSWDNLQKKPPGTSLIPRRGGNFLWEQFHTLSKLGVDSACVAMFDEMDEGTAILKITNSPPVQGHFVTYDGLPSDWYLRLVGEGTKLLRDKPPVPAEIPIKP